MTKRTAGHASRIRFDFCAVEGAVPGSIELDDLEGLYAVLLGLQLDRAHQYAVRPQVRGELVALLLRYAERIT